MPRKLPALNADNRAFWQGGKQGELLIHRCAACSRYFHPPAPLCAHCASFDVAPEAVSGKGKVLSYTINHQAWTPDLVEPYVVAIVELVEQPGLQFVSNVVGLPVTDVHIDMPVRVSFLNVEDVWLPLFEKDQ
ncbi:OB-fold domain-containing protein [Pseudomonas sp. V98_8]|uniref:Zn-ribbon domain-containing OB-fold protein n=1 Tax=Pseudomonas sp. V98_8 TaxID=3044228 RepID=UPI00249DC53D|nr:OB-fold domain-containing protein [Pseudomonas sp. V98_8]MDI3391260.1 OB-fold domain-containing protein [Pseudomonas sp. V98_8]